MKSIRSYCLGDRQYSQTVDKIIYEKVNTKTKKLFKIMKGKSDVCGRNKSQIFTK